MRLIMLDCVGAAIAGIDQYIKCYVVQSELSFYFAFAVDEEINTFTFTHTPLTWGKSCQTRPDILPCSDRLC